MSWWRGVGMLAVGAYLVLGVGVGVAAAEPGAPSSPAGSSESKPAKSSNDPADPADVAGSIGKQRDSAEVDDTPVKPTSTVGATPVTSVERPEKTVEPEPVEKVAEEDPTPARSSKRPAVVKPVLRPVEPIEQPLAKPETAIAEVASGIETAQSETAPPETTQRVSPMLRSVVADEAPPKAARATPNVDLASLAVTPTMAAPPQPNLINVIGTLLFTVLTLPLKLLEQTPVVPPGYSVTVGRSTLDVGCGCGQTVDARWYFPDQEAHGGVPPPSIIYLQHGFIRSNSAMSAMAIEMAQRTNSVVVTPTLTSNPFTSDGCWINGEPMQRAVADLFTGPRTALTESAVAAGWTGGALPTRFMLAGHSAGGGLAAAAAGFTTENGTVSDLLLVVLLDGVPTGDALPVALGKLTGTNARQVLQIASPPYIWNSNGLGAAQLVAARPGQFVGVQLVGGSHVDYEGASSDFLARLAAGFPRPENVVAAQDLAVGWINDAIAGRVVAAPGGPGQTIAIPTTAGIATGVVLGGSLPVAATSGREPIGELA